MPVLFQIAIAIISFALAYLLRPKPQKQSSQQQDVQFPSVSEGVEIPVFFGVVWSGDATVVWWGDLEIQEVEL